MGALIPPGKQQKYSKNDDEVFTLENNDELKQTVLSNSCCVLNIYIKKTSFNCVIYFFCKEKGKI